MSTIWYGQCPDCGASSGEPCRMGCPNYQPGGGTSEMEWDE